MDEIKKLNKYIDLHKDTADSQKARFAYQAEHPNNVFMSLVNAEWLIKNLLQELVSRNLTDPDYVDSSKQVMQEAYAFLIRGEGKIDGRP
jgi:hypothetical protein